MQNDDKTIYTEERANVVNEENGLLPEGILTFYCEVKEQFAYIGINQLIVIWLFTDNSRTGNCFPEGDHFSSSSQSGQ